MTRPFHSFRLERTRHVLRAGQRARQIAGLLGFDRPQQSAISAAVFAIAYKAVGDYKSARMRFLLSENRLLVRCYTSSNRKVERPTLPYQASRGIPPYSSRPAVDINSASFGDLALEPDLMTLSFPLPDGSPRLDAADLPWVIREMGRITPLDPLEEFYQLNRELLRLIRLTNADWNVQSQGGHAA
jgi:hypothetical protein